MSDSDDTHAILLLSTWNAMSVVPNKLTEMQTSYLTHYADKNKEKESRVQFPEQTFLDCFPLITVRILVADVRMPLDNRIYFDIA